MTHAFQHLLNKEFYVEQLILPKFELEKRVYRLVNK